MIGPIAKFSGGNRRVWRLIGRRLYQENRITRRKTYPNTIFCDNSIFFGLGFTIVVVPEHDYPKKITKYASLRIKRVQIISFPIVRKFECPKALKISRDSSVVYAGLRTGWSGFGVPAGDGNFFLHHRVQNGSRLHPASYPMGNRGSSPMGKAAGAWIWPLTSI
jgi:hypothetical protein